jgi:hypothetical protein
MATYAYTFTSGDTVTPTKLNNARTVSEIVNADIASAANIAGSKLEDGAITNAKVNASAAIAHTKLANITAGQVLMGNASNAPTATALSGDVTVNSSGVTAIGAGVIVDADINASAAIGLSKLATGALPTAITVASANIVDGTIVNADVSGSAAIALSKLATGALPTAITVASANIVDGTIVNADVSDSAAIAGSKISADFGSQNVTIADKIIHGGDTDTCIRFPASDNFSVETGGSEALFVSALGSLRVSSSDFGVDVTTGGWSFQNNGFGTFYRNSSTSTDAAWACYSNWGATKRLVYNQRTDGNVLNYNNSYGQLSDASLKENIASATPKLDDINKVRVVNFNFKGDSNKQIGVVAQEIEQVWPNIVSTEEDGTKSVKYSVLVPILIKAVQELSAKVSALESAQ